MHGRVFSVFFRSVPVSFTSDLGHFITKWQKKWYQKYMRTVSKASFVEHVLLHYLCVWGSIQQQQWKSYVNFCCILSSQNIKKQNNNTMAKEKISKSNCSEAWQNNKTIQQYKMQLGKSNCFCTKTRRYKSKGLLGVQTGDSSLRQFPFNNRWVKLFIYSPLLLSFLLSSVCLFCLQSQKTRATWQEGQTQRHLRWWKENQRGDIIFIFSQKLCYTQ